MTISIEAKNLDGSVLHFELDRFPDRCPICHHHIEPKTSGGAYARSGDLSIRLQMAFRCPRRQCQSLFIATFKDQEHSRALYLKSTAPFTPESPAQPEKVAALSPRFVEIYKQAASAEHFELEEIAGMGYRKALEVLVKDFAIKRHPEKEKQIKGSLLGNVIEEYLDDSNVKRSAKRAIWLGNDEAHYERKWIDKDIKDLIKLIQLTRNAIENVLLGDHYEEDMSSGKK